MNTEQFRKTIDELHERLVALTVTKGEEYKRREDNQFSNFERGAAALGLTREQVLMVYLSKHLDSITTWVRDTARGESREYAEPITGRVDDAILYLLLLRGMATEHQQGHHWLHEAGSPKGVVINSGMVVTGTLKIHDPETIRRMESMFRGAPVMEEAVQVGLVENPIDPACKVGPIDKDVHEWNSRTGRFADEPPRDDTLANGHAAIKPRPRMVFISANHAWAVEACKRHDAPPGTCALASVNQLHGIDRGCTEVVYIHQGNLDSDHMWNEVREYCQRHGLTYTTGRHV